MSGFLLGLTRNSGKGLTNNYVPNAVNKENDVYVAYENSLQMNTADLNKIAFSLWINFANVNSNIFATPFVFELDGTFISSDWSYYLWLSSTGILEFRMVEGTTTVYRRQSNSISANLWYHILFCKDYDAGMDEFWINGASQPATIVDLASNDLRDDPNAFYLGKGPGASSFLPTNTGLAEVWIAPGQSVDFSSKTNRDKFALLNKPADLGADGSKPTGTQPSFYFPNGNPDFGDNEGDGVVTIEEDGAFTDWTGSEVSYA